MNIPTSYPAYNVHTAPKNLALASLVDMFKARGGSEGTPRADAPAAAALSLDDVTPSIAVLADAHSVEPAPADGPEFTCHLTQVRAFLLCV